MYGSDLLLVLLAPFLAIIAVGIVFPIGFAAVESVVTGPRLGDAYLALLGDPTFWRVLARTLMVGAGVSAICTVVAYPTAVFIQQASPRLRPILLALVIIPLLSSTVARTYGWVGIFIRGGLLDQISEFFGGGPLRLLYTQLAVTVGMVGVLLPYALLPILAALMRYDERLSLASQSLGAGGIRTLLRIKLPVLAPSIAGGATAVFILALGFFITPALLGGPSSQLISNLISQQILQRFDLARGDAMGIVLILAVLAVVGLAALSGRIIRAVRR